MYEEKKKLFDVVVAGQSIRAKKTFFQDKLYLAQFTQFWRLKWKTQPKMKMKK